MIDITDLIGTKFVNHGRDKRLGFDCYGYAIEISNRFGHKLEDVWYEASTDDEFSKDYPIVLKKMEKKLSETDELEEGNLILFSDENGNMVHIGVLLDDERFTHCDGGGVKVSFLSSYYRKRWKVYKWLK